MLRRSLVPLAVVAMCGALVSVAVAANAHFKRNGTPTCGDTGTTLACTGTLAGLGNADLVVNLSADALATFNCGAPGNGNIAKGQNKIPFTATGSQTIPKNEIKNGTVTFNVFAPQTPPETPSPTQAGCPNPHWQVIGLSEIDFENVVLTIAQGGVTLFTCTNEGAQVPPDGTKITLSC